MKRILIYDTSVKGHHLEYLHHIYMATEDVEAEFIFVMPEEYNFVKNNLLWPTRHNVSFDFISNSEIERIGGGYLKKRWYLAKLAAKYIKKSKADEVFFIELIIQFPFLPLLIPNRVQVSGILYRLVPYEWKYLSTLKKIKDAIEICTIGKSLTIKTPMCLNDNSCACFYNKKLGVSKFVSIVDPVNILNYQPKSIRNEIGASSKDKIILHIGGMCERKGTLLLLEAANMMEESKLKNFIFVFAGQIGDDIKTKFEEDIDKLRKKARVVVYEGFCSYFFLSDLSFSCDCIVIPYKNTSYSSGIIGYASIYGKTVIGPGEGLLGKIIRRNKIGVTMRNLNTDHLAEAILNIDRNNIINSKYLSRHSVKSFQDTVIFALLRSCN